MKGSMQYKTERICRTYIETGRTIRSLADLYKLSKSTIGKYLLNYASKYVDYDLFTQVRERAKQNLNERNQFGRSLNYDSSMVGSMD